jgi:lipoprotein signal peptidase
MVYCDGAYEGTVVRANGPTLSLIARHQRTIVTLSIANSSGLTACRFGSSTKRNRCLRVATSTLIAFLSTGNALQSANSRQFPTTIIS